MRPFPSLTDVEDRPLMLTELSSYEDDDDTVFVKAWTNEPRPSDALIRSISEEVYDTDTLITFANCKLTMTQEVLKPSTTAEFVGSYVNESNS